MKSALLHCFKNPISVGRKFVHVVLTAFLLFFINANAHCQNNVYNIGFESGTFINWHGATGQCCPVFTPNPGIDTSRHLITSGSSFDPYSGNLIGITAPGSVYSARLGNDNNSAESEMLEFSFTVPSDSLILQLSYAVVLEDGLHPLLKQPRFSYRVTSNGAPLSGCTSVDVIAGNNFPGIIKTSQYEFLPWQKNTIPLINRSGETITIHLETGDCGPGGHFGYAYIDCELFSCTVTNSGCRPDGSIVLFAPGTLNGIWFDGSTGNSVLISEPLPGVNYYYEVNPNTSCAILLSHYPDISLPLVSFNSVDSCNGLISFSNTSTYSGTPLMMWNFGDGQTAASTNPVHTYHSSGNYPVELLIMQQDGCRGKYTSTVSVNTEKEIKIQLSDSCLGKETTLHGTVIPDSIVISSWNWYVHDISVSDNNPATHTFYNHGPNSIMLVATDNFGCSDTAKLTVQVSNHENCIADQISPFIPSAFTPNGDGINDTFQIPDSDFFRDVTFTIFNRNGQLIYAGSSWNGMHGNLTCMQGLYSYRLTYILNNNTKFAYGTVSLVK